jgi:hypothetical protein
MSKGTITYQGQCIALFSKPFFRDESYERYLNEKIIRYFPIRHFKSLITTSKFYFSNSCYVSDIRERLPSDEDKTRLRIYNENIKGWRKISKDKLFHSPELIKPVSFLSCWSHGDFDRKRCWEEYIEENEFGIALVTSIRKFRDSLKVEENKQKYFRHGDVEYSEYTRFNDPYSLFFRKDLCFNWENEYRILFQGLDYPMSGFSSIKSGLNKRKGIEFDINLHKLIEKLIVKPGSSSQQKDQVCKLIEQRSLSEDLVINSEIQ